jgi:beta-phosphoglucomutase-like phosphatase (HAD superfamily)
MGSFQAALFDMDGVVIDTRHSITEFWESVAIEQGVALTADDYDRHIHGVPCVQTIRALFPAITPEKEGEFLDRVARYERALRYAEIAGAGAILRSLKSACVRIALVTSGTESKVAEVFRQLSIGGLFDVVITARDIERGKPHPACSGYLLARMCCFRGCHQWRAICRGSRFCLYRSSNGAAGQPSFGRGRSPRHPRLFGHPHRKVG